MTISHVLVRRLQWVSLAVAVVAGLGFGALYAFRAELYQLTEVEPANLGSLYPVGDLAVAIAGLSRPQPAHLKVHLRNTTGCAPWRLVIDGEPHGRLDGAAPSIPLVSGRHVYDLTPTGCDIARPAVDTVTLHIFFGLATSQGFRIQGVTADQIQLDGANVPTLMNVVGGFDRWVPDVTSADPAAAAAARATLDRAGFDANASTRDKIAFLVDFVRDRMPGGSPPPFLNRIRPWAVYKQAYDNGIGCFCRQWSLVYAYLANVVGIPSRNLFTGGASPVVDLGSHAFSESYIAEEARWAYVDPTNDIAYVTNAAGHVLNGAEIYMAMVSGTGGALTARFRTASGFVNKPFADVAAPVRYFMHRENFLIYVGSHDGRYQLRPTGAWRYLDQLYRFLFQPQQYFGLTSFQSAPWLRPASFFLALIAGLLFVVVTGIRLVRRRAAEG